MPMAMPVRSLRLSLRVIYLMDVLCISILFTHFTVLNIIYILYYLLKCMYIAIIILYTNFHFQMYYVIIVIIIIICNKNIVS